MGENAGIEQPGAGQVPAGGFQQQPTGGENPAWNEILQAVPEQFHAAMRPTLQKWDQGVQQRFQQVHSQVEPWQQLTQQGITPDDVVQALGILQTINENPQEVYNALAEHLGYSEDGGQGGAESDEGDDSLEEYDDPRISELQQGYQDMAQIIIGQHEEAIAAQEDDELDDYLNGLTEKFGQYDERYVLAMMDAGMDGEEAVQQYQQLVAGQAAQLQRPVGPAILSPGSAPSQAMNPADLTDKGRRELLAQMLGAANRQGG